MPSIPKEIAREAQEIARSGHITGSWYASTYPDVAATGLKPSEHYALLGARMGRDPNPQFETRFYVETAGAFLIDGENPLLHHLRHGLHAGHPGRERVQLVEVERLSRHLWGALPDAAGEALRAIAESPAQGQRARFEALAHLASRADFDGRQDEAAALLARIDAAAPRWARAKGALMRRGVLASRMGDAALARACFERVRPVSGPGGATEPDMDAALALAGLEADDDARLAATGAALARRGLEPLVRRDPARPLTLANLAAAPAPRGLPPMGRVSVIVPAYRAEASLETALRSLTAQSYPDLEILVVDDASPDATFEVAGAMAREDARIRPLRAARNGGAYAARNIGLARATGAFVTTHDADDWSHPRKIEAQLRAFLRDPGVMACASSWARVRADLRCTTNWRLGEAIVHLNHSSVMLRREAADRLGPWDEVRTGADSEYMWRVQSVFGRGSFTSVAPGLPLAFGLDEEDSLSRAKATHLVTNYHGLRLAYREVVRHHLRAEDPLDPEARALKLRRIPSRMRGVRPPPEPLDLCLVGDLFVPDVVDGMAAILADPASAGARVGILHEPTLASTARRFARALWTLVDGERVRLLVDPPGPEARTVRVAPTTRPPARPVGPVTELPIPDMSTFDGREPDGLQDDDATWPAEEDEA